VGAKCSSAARIRAMHPTDHAPSPVRASRLDLEPWYLPIADEVALFEAAWQARLPVVDQGAHRLWQDTPGGAHGNPSGTAAYHGVVS